VTVDTATASAASSIEKALDVCEALSGAPRGMSLTDLSRVLKQPPSSVHRLLARLKRRGYVRQDEDTQWYGLTLKMLDLSFRALGHSELRFHAYPLLREYVVRSGQRAFIAIPQQGEVTYIWTMGADEVAMRTVQGKDMPNHCAIYFSPEQGARRLSCLKLAETTDIARSGDVLRRLDTPGLSGDGSQRLICTCAPVRDYTGREVARVGVFGHGPDERPILSDHNRGAWELARRISMRLGHVAAPVDVPA